MNGKWIAGMAIGILLAVQSAPLLAQDVQFAALRERAMPAAARNDLKAEPPKAALERVIAEGNALLELGNPANALERFTLALSLATQAESHADLTYAMYRAGLAHRRLYENNGDVRNLKAAVAYWEHERTLYIWHEYPAGFHALAGFDLGQAYLALARHENLIANSKRGLAIVDEALKTFDTATASYQAALRPLESSRPVK